LTKERYIESCEITGSTPIEEEMPVDETELTFDLLRVLQVYRLLKSTMDSFSGVYTGKDLSLLDYLFNLYEVPKDLQLIYLEYIIIIDEDNISYYASKSNKKAKVKNGG